MTKRRRSRESALQVLYQWDITQQDTQKGLAHFKEHFLLNQESDPFLEQIVQGVLTHCQEIDRLIEQYSENWRLGRITSIDRTILRIAIFELLYCEEIPPKVTLNEAVDLGKRFGTEHSGSFINGILDRILNEVVQKSGKMASMNP
ncbi:MAG: transcription antitermination factor NusB [Deltaproteobacteria bacterium RBG_16_47_11]|nr:MAG: transcription antitermination factor NusB [Deltaproteobacteria bacterium RBG_16_47_11]